MYQKILVPLDGSRAGEIALPYVVEIAAKFNTEITLVCVSESDVEGVDNLYRYYLERVTGQLQRQLKEYGAAPEAKVRNEVLLGTPSQKIVNYASENDFGLIAMASRGSSSKGPWLLGDITAKVLRSSDRPVMLVRIPAIDADLEQKKLIKKILIPLDGSKAGEAAIHYTEELARALGAEMILVQVMEPIIAWAGFEGSVSYATPQDEESRKAAATAYLSSVSKTLTERNINNSITVAFGSAADQIIDYAAANDIDLIAMSSHGRSGIGRWVFGSITAKVLRAGDTPVLVVRATKD